MGMIDNSKPATLYRLFGPDDDLLYIGASMHGPARLDAHRRSQSWWPEVTRATFEHYETRHAAVAAEALAIDSERPKYNKAPGRFCSKPSDEIDRSRVVSKEEAEERRMRRTYYRVNGLTCGYCGWVGKWVLKGSRVEEATCPECGLREMTGTPEAEAAAA